MQLHQLHILIKTRAHVILQIDNWYQDQKNKKKNPVFSGLLIGRQKHNQADMPYNKNINTKIWI